jgi:hypothetical protein
MHLLAQGMPAMPVFTDRRGRVIGDVVNYDLYDDEYDDANQPLVDDADLPGVHTDEAGGDFEIPGVDPVQQELQQAPTTPAETEPEVDLDFAPTNEGNVDPPMVLSNDAPEAPAVAVDDGVRRSTRVHTQAKPTYIPTMTGKKYSFATTVLGGTMLGDEAYEYNQRVAYSFMQQLSVKAALKQWGDNARVAGEKETSQLHWRETLVPKRISDLTSEQRDKILQSHMFVVKKRDGVTKARVGILPDGYIRTNPLPQITTRQSVPPSKDSLLGYYRIPIAIPTLRSLVGPTIDKVRIPWLSFH